MSMYLAYSYSTGLTKDEEAEIDKRVQKSQTEFRKGATFALAIYSVYSLTTTAVHAMDPPAPGTFPRELQPAPVAKPGMKPVSDGIRGTFIGGASAICAAALQSGDFMIGLGCAGMLIIAGIIMNRP